MLGIDLTRQNEKGGLEGRVWGSVMRPVIRGRRRKVFHEKKLAREDLRTLGKEEGEEVLGKSPSDRRK